MIFFSNHKHDKQRPVEGTKGVIEEELMIEWLKDKVPKQTQTITNKHLHRKIKIEQHEHN